MKNKLLLLSIFGLTVLTTSCFTNKRSNNNSVKNTEKLEYIGTYDSKKGIMNDISCYCFEVGFFVATSGEELVICFEELKEEASCSENLKITGYLKTVTISPENTSPCSAGKREIFYVTDFECQ